MTQCDSSGSWNFLRFPRHRKTCFCLSSSIFIFLSHFAHCSYNCLFSLRGSFLSTDLLLLFIHSRHFELVINSIDSCYYDFSIYSLSRFQMYSSNYWFQICNQLWARRIFFNFQFYFFSPGYYLATDRKNKNSFNSCTTPCIVCTVVYNLLRLTYNGIIYRQNINIMTTSSE